MRESLDGLKKQKMRIIIQKSIKQVRKWMEEATSWKCDTFYFQNNLLDFLIIQLFPDLTTPAPQKEQMFSTPVSYWNTDNANNDVSWETTRKIAFSWKEEHKTIIPFHLWCCNSQM